MVFSILRNPFDIIASNKVIALVRGSTKKEFKGGFSQKRKIQFLDIYQSDTRSVFLANASKKK